MQNETVLSYPSIIPVERQQKILSTNGIRMTPIENTLSEILFITSYPPKECGIATYSQDLVNALNNTFNHSFKINICPLAVENEQYVYAKTPEYTLNPNSKISFIKLAFRINKNNRIKTVVIQHEFGFFSKEKKKFLQFLQTLNKPIVIAFHTVLPNPDELLKIKVQQISSIAESIIVMTHASEKILIKEYGIPKQKITVIAHGTHLVPHLDNGFLKNKYALSGKKVLSTFGLLSSGKSIETTLEALPAIIKQNPDVLFLIIGKTHPSVVQQEGEKYRQMLEAKVEALHLHDHVQFINYFLPLPNLLEYLQLTDIYLFTSKDPNQAVSGTFSYAISCGCPVISTPIPHACEVLKNDAGIIIDFEDAEKLSKAVISLLNNEPLRKKISSNGLHRIAPTAWENAAIAHAMLFERMSNGQILLHYNTPNINLDHIKKLTTDVGIIQFSIINQPDINSGYTLDDNARAMIAMCQHFALTKDEVDLQYIYTYFNFIKFCLQPEGYFLNYVSEEQKFTTQNNDTNLEDANGRAIWALGYLISISNILPVQLTADAASTMQTALLNAPKIHSTRAMAFIIKGLYYHNTKNKSPHHTLLITELANRLVQMYRHECDEEWQWFEGYLTYANSILSEAMLCAWLATNNMVYKEIAQSSFDFLLYKIFTEKTLNVISNKTWLNKDDAIITHKINGGEQPIDVAYTIIALGKFYEVFKDEKYMHKMKIAFSWFLGNNHLHQIMYNPCTGGCFDGLEEDDVNLNQGAESTVSYLMARLTVEKYFNTHTSSKGSNGDV